jgi:hypothetical protein
MLNKELVQMLVMKKYTIYKLFCIHYNEWQRDHDWSSTRMQIDSQMQTLEI